MGPGGPGGPGSPGGPSLPCRKEGNGRLPQSSLRAAPPRQAPSSSPVPHVLLSLPVLPDVQTAGWGLCLWGVQLFPTPLPWPSRPAPRLTLSPGLPASPTPPAEPGSPGIPGFPGSPARPGDPGGPLSPRARPGGPWGPGSPRSPFGPRSPDKPTGPWRSRRADAGGRATTPSAGCPHRAAHTSLPGGPRSPGSPLAPRRRSGTGRKLPELSSQVSTISRRADVCVMVRGRRRRAPYCSPRAVPGPVHITCPVGPPPAPMPSPQATYLDADIFQQPLHILETQAT